MRSPDTVSCGSWVGRTSLAFTFVLAVLVLYLLSYGGALRICFRVVSSPGDVTCVVRPKWMRFYHPIDTVFPHDLRRPSGTASGANLIERYRFYLSACEKDGLRRAFRRARAAEEL